jgi:hypothetical protein
MLRFGVFGGVSSKAEEEPVVDLPATTTTRLGAPPGATNTTVGRDRPLSVHHMDAQPRVVVIQLNVSIA